MEVVNRIAVQVGGGTLHLAVGSPGGDGVGAEARLDQVVVGAALDELALVGALDEVLLVGVEPEDDDRGRIGPLPVIDIVNVDRVVVAVVEDREQAARGQCADNGGDVVAAAVEPRHFHDVSGLHQRGPILHRVHLIGSAINDAPEAAALFVGKHVVLWETSAGVAGDGIGDEAAIVVVVGTAIGFIEPDRGLHDVVRRDVAAVDGGAYD